MSGMLRSNRNHALVAILAALAAATAGGTAAAGDDLRLSREVLPLFETIRLTLDPSRTDYTGSARIDLDVKEATAAFRFHAQDLSLDRVALATAKGRSIEAATTRGELGLVTLTAGETLAPGAYTLDVDFSGHFGTRTVGLYRVEQGERAYTFTQFEAEDARRAFPCFDEPAFKIPYQLTLVVPEGHLAVTNTPVDRESTAAGWRTVVFAKTPPLPSYLLAIATGPLDAVEIPGMSIPGRVITVSGRKELAGLAAKTAPPVLAALEKYFDRRYPFAKLDLIAVPDYWPGAMENPGAITFSEPILLADPNGSGPSQRRSLARTLAHELAHMWFGDLVTMQWWDDLWLNESFADWMGDKITAQVFPEFEIELTELRGVEMTMTGDARPSTQAIRRRVEPSDNKLENVGTAYNKGKTVLGMFEAWAGPEKFRRGVLDYLRAHEWGNATAGDLWTAVSKAAGQDLGPAMENFLEQGGLPLIAVEPLDAGRVRLTQRRFANFGVSLPAQRWIIPITLKFPEGSSTRTLSVLLGDESRVVEPGAAAPAWVLPDAGASGYYRWSVPPEMLESMARDAGRFLTPRERIGFLGNLSALLDAGAVHGDDYLRLVGRFSNDTQPQVLSSVLASLGKVKSAFVPDESRDLFAHYVRATLGPVLDRFGLAPGAGEDENLSIVRAQLIGWLGEEGEDPRVLDHARRLARSYLADPGSVDPSLAGVALRLAALDGDRALFDSIRQKLESSRTPQERSRYLGALGAFRDPALSEETVRYALEGKLRPQEVFQVTQGLGGTSSGRDRLFKFVTDNYDTLLSRVPPQFAGFMPMFASGCEPERLEAARTFFTQPAHAAPGTANTLARVSDQVNDCAGLRRREGGAVAAYLKAGSGQP